MNSIMISIKPEAVKAIASGMKRADIRKDCPRYITTPFRVYLYEMSGELKNRQKLGYTCFRYDGRGMVVGEVVCNDIQKFSDGTGYEQASVIGMSTREIAEVLGGKEGYVLYFSDVQMYDTPKPLEAFGKKIPPHSWYYIDENERRAF